jgi:hypothetical protein
MIFCGGRYFVLLQILAGKYPTIDFGNNTDFSLSVPVFFSILQDFGNDDKSFEWIFVE